MFSYNCIYLLHCGIVFLFYRIHVFLLVLSISWNVSKKALLIFFFFVISMLLIPFLTFEEI